MNDELIAKLSSATCAADIQRIATELGKELSAEDAEAIFAEIKRTDPPEGELSDEMLMAVSGGFDWPQLVKAMVDQCLRPSAN